MKVPVHGDFSPRDTNIVKAVAVVMLLTHHLYMGVLPAPIDIANERLLTVIATLSKVCVATFVMLSGYGLAVSFKRREERDPVRFTLIHTLKLMWPYWLVYMIFALGAVFFGRPEYTPEAVYGTGVRGAAQALIEFLALRPIFRTATLNQTWWYMEAALALYLTFPLIYFAVKRFPYIALPVAAVPVVLYYFLGNNDGWDSCREIYWFLPFAVGVFLAQRGLLDKFSARLRGRRGWAATCAVTAGFIACAFIRGLIGLAFDTVFALSLILFLRATLCRVPVLDRVAEYVGSRSGDIFLVHSFIYCYYVSQHRFVKLLWSPKLYVELSALPLLLILSLVCAEGLRLIRKVVVIKLPRE